MFSPYHAVEKGNLGAGQNHARMTSYRVVQTLYKLRSRVRNVLGVHLYINYARATFVYFEYPEFGLAASLKVIKNDIDTTLGVYFRPCKRQLRKLTLYKIKRY